MNQCTYCTENSKRTDCFDTYSTTQCVQPVCFIQTYCGERKLHNSQKGNLDFTQSVQPQTFCQWDLNLKEDASSIVTLQIEFTSTVKSKQEIGRLYVASTVKEKIPTQDYQIYTWEKLPSLQHSFKANKLSLIYITSNEPDLYSGFKMSWETSDSEEEDEEQLDGTILYLLVAFIGLFLVTFLVICCFFLRRLLKSRYIRNQTYVVPHPNSSLNPLNVSSLDQVASESGLIQYSPILHYDKKLLEVGDSVCSICFDEYDILRFKESVPIRKLPCKHLFHADCIGHWLSAPNRACPNCNSNILVASQNERVRT